MRRPRGLPGDAGQRARGAGATRAGSARHRSFVFPDLPSPRRVPLETDITCGADGDSWEWEGRGGAGTKEPGAPEFAERATHLAPGTRHLLRAPRLSGQGVGLERSKDIARGQDGFESTEAMNSVNPRL